MSLDLTTEAQELGARELRPGRSHTSTPPRGPNGRSFGPARLWRSNFRVPERRKTSGPPAAQPKPVWQVGEQNTMILNLTPGTQSSGFAAEKADLGAPAASEAAALERDRLERRLRAAGAQPLSACLSCPLADLHCSLPQRSPPSRHRSGTQREHFDSSLRQRVEAAATPPPSAGGARPFYSRAHDTRTGVAAGAAARAAALSLRCAQTLTVR